MTRVPPVEETKTKLRELVEGRVAAADPRSELVRLSVRRIIEEALEAVTRDVLGRDHYERREGRTGYRNGYRESSLRTAEGQVEFAVPQVRDTDNASIAAMRARLKGRTEELEDLALEMYARGCSTRDIEAAFRADDGRSLLSRTAVSEITEALWAEYEEFATRDLSEHPPLYLFLDGVAERLRPGAKREAVLAAWAICWDGRKVLLHLSPGTKESTENCKEFLNDLKRRGLSDPVLVATDGAAGLIRAVEECFPASLRQRCLAHKKRNIAAKLPAEAIDEFRAAANAAYEAPTTAMAEKLRDDLVARFGRTYPSAVQCFEEDFGACIAHLKCPTGHRRLIRTTNLLERMFVEERRRVRAAGHLFGERAVLKLMYSAINRAAEGWRGIAITDFERRQLERLAEELRVQHREATQPAVKTSPSRSRQKKRA
jgi:transposase-like protein